MLSQQLTLLLYDAKIQDDTSTLLSLSHERNLKSKYSSNESAQVQLKYGAEEELIKNQISEVSEQMGDAESGSDEYKGLVEQYKDLKYELNSLEDAKEAEKEKIEQTATDYENEIETEMSSVETDLEATREDREAIKENLDEDIEDSFSYFTD